MRIKSPIQINEDELEDLDINGLQGRLLHLKSSKNKKIVLLAGQHTAHERLYSLAQFLSDYGEVYSPDLPGFGGMDSFFTISQDPSYDNYASYIYTFLKSKDLTKDVTIFAVSFSAQCVTRMFQMYPDSQMWVKNIIGFVGFAGGQDFNISKLYRASLYSIIYPTSTYIGAKLFTIIFLNRFSVRAGMYVFSFFKAKMQSDESNLKKEMVKMEAYLWTVNDQRTHSSTAKNMFQDDMRRYTRQKIDLDMYNVITAEDQYFDVESVKKSFSDLYRSYTPLNINLGVHTPSIVSEKEEFYKMMSKETMQLLES